MNRHGFPAACPIPQAAVFCGLSILIHVIFVIAWAPRCEAGPEIRPVSGMGYTVFATGLAGPRGLLFSRSGDLFAAEQSGGNVVRITPDGRVSRIAKGFSAPHDLAFDAFGYLYVADTGANRVAMVSPDGSVTEYIPGLNVPVDLAFHPNGELFVCELYAGTVTAYKSGKKVKVVASGLDKPHGLAFDNTGVTYINEWSGNRILKMDQKGRLQPLAAVEDPVGVAIGKSGDLYVAQPQAGKVSKVKMDGTRITLIEGLNEPRDPAFDQAGNLFVAETGAGRILKMTGDY
ncbi:MAG: NHL repeat-containing protein [Deltaproteobacteria bacterium]|nr:NHL repeat-containing protein [Candidatus Deferrimicrobium borealis]